MNLLSILISFLKVESGKRGGETRSAEHNLHISQSSRNYGLGKKREKEERAGGLYGGAKRVIRHRLVSVGLYVVYDGIGELEARRREAICVRFVSLCCHIIASLGRCLDSLLLLTVVKVNE